MLITRLLLLSFMLFTLPDDKPKNSLIFISPLKIPVSLSANFGELRADHFHSGIDLKTQGVTGHEVLAASEGYIYRISVSPGGFGKALYIRHPSGFSTVYGHLDKFSDEIEEYVIGRQYERKSFMVNIYPEKETFQVQQGELIAYSGNSGSSFGPHLHYEIRKSDNEVPVNPLMFDFGAGDDISPVIQNLVIYPLGKKAFINGQNKMKKLDVSGYQGNYSVTSSNDIYINGPAGFGIRTYDLLNGSYNRCGVYSIELSIDSSCIYKYVMDGFSFTESRFINSHIDYGTYIRDNIYVQRMFSLPNDKLGVYKDLINRGIFSFTDNKVHNVQVSVTDVHNNRSVLNFKVKPYDSDLPELTDNQDNNLRIMPFGKSNKFISNDITVSIPGGALYDTLFFEYKRESGTSDMLSDVHVVHNRYTPLHKPFKLAIKPQKLIAGMESKMLIAQISDNMKRTGLNSEWENGYLTTDVRSFGNYCIDIDTVPPSISSLNLAPGTNISGRKEIRIRISDSFSGIKSYEPSIDGKWALFEYDAKNDLLTYRLDPARITKGNKHQLLLTVTDNRNNVSRLSCDFTW